MTRLRHLYEDEIPHLDDAAAVDVDAIRGIPTAADDVIMNLRGNAAWTRLSHLPKVVWLQIIEPHHH